MTAGGHAQITTAERHAAQQPRPPIVSAFAVEPWLGRTKSGVSRGKFLHSYTSHMVAGCVQGIVLGEVTGTALVHLFLKGTVAGLKHDLMECNVYQLLTNATLANGEWH